MLFRIPTKWVETYASALLFVKRLLVPVQTTLTACWVLALFHRKSFDAMERESFAATFIKPPEVQE